MTPEETRAVMAAPDGPPGITDPRVFSSLMVGFVAAVVLVYKPEHRAEVAREYAELVRMFALARGKTLGELQSVPEPKTRFASTDSVAGFLGALVTSAGGVEDVIAEGCRVLGKKELWERMLPAIIDPAKAAEAAFGKDASQQMGLHALGVVPKKDGSS